MANDGKAITNPRRAFLLETVKVDQLKGLEIGHQKSRIRFYREIGFDI